MDDFNGVQVKDAQTDPFILKDRRNGGEILYEFHYRLHVFP